MLSGDRLLALMLTAAMLLGLVACGGAASPPTSEPSEVTQTATSVTQSTASPTEVPEPTPVPSPSPDHTGHFGPVIFSSGFDETAGEPVDVGMAFDHGITRLYAYWPYNAVQVGQSFRWDFYHDGSQFYGEYATFRDSRGHQWQWIFETDGDPLSPGTYELVVKVGEEVVLQDSCTVREEPSPTATVAPSPTHTAAPLPTSTPTVPPQPTPTFSPTREPRPAVGWVEVLNYCGSDMTFTIAGQMYTVGANSNQRIELAPGEYTYTASLGLGRYGDINGTVTVRPGVVSQLPFSADV
jgi:predicted component of type VI protein secretion system